MGNCTFAEKYRIAVPKTARFINKWDVVPCLPPKNRGSDGDESQWNDDPEGFAFMKGIVAKVTEVYDLILPDEFEHVCESVQLEIGLLSRFLWLATKSCTAFTYFKEERLPDWDEAKSEWLTDLIEPHFLTSYKSNLEIAFSGQPFNSVEAVAQLVTDNYGTLQAGFRSLTNGSMKAEDTKELIKNSGLREEIAKQAAGTSSNLLTGLSVANLAVNVIGHAGTWYGLWCVNHNVTKVKGTIARVEDVARSIRDKIERLPEAFQGMLEIHDIKRVIRELQALVKVQVQNLELESNRVRNRNDSHIEGAELKANELLDRIKHLQDISKQNDQSHMLAANFVCQVLDAICAAWLLEVKGPPVVGSPCCLILGSLWDISGMGCVFSKDDQRSLMV